MKHLSLVVLGLAIVLCLIVPSTVSASLASQGSDPSLESKVDELAKLITGKFTQPKKYKIALSSSSPQVSSRFVGVWKDSEKSKDFYYEIKSNGFVYSCELENARVVDLDTGTISDTIVTYSGGDREDITSDIEESSRVESLPQICR